ncbi:MAG TPA: transglutaminase [Porphyromonadaceae bacterium]|nr:transglutaminase [Porphyromonadaceae bacterium]
MKKLIWIIPFLMMACNAGRKPAPDAVVAQEITAGNFTRAAFILDSLMSDESLSDDKKGAYAFTKDSLHRVALDFNRSRDEIVSWIKERHGFTPTEEQLAGWENSLALEYRLIDGEKRYFRNAAPNLFRVDAQARALSKAPVSTDVSGTTAVLDKHLSQMGKPEQNGRRLLPPQTMRVKYTLTVDSGAVEEGETVRAWLPYPRRDVPRQSDVVFIGASHPGYILSDDQTAHTSIYMEQKARQGQPVAFWAEYEFTSRGEWFDLSRIEALPYDTASTLYKTYTAERTPHILFTPRLKELADSITHGAETPVDVLRSVYRFITATYPWASALEYSTIANIPEYVMQNRKGDCGQVGLLLIAMLRYKGIPARWQSGWMMHPGEVNLHDWAEVYLEGTGWIPCDPSFGRGDPLQHPAGRDFFMSGIDSYRFYVNSDYSGGFLPEKKFPRSETVDFQRGEVETASRNLYFNQWRYKMEVTYR